MLCWLKIKNFKSHRNSNLDFHEGVNVIVGDPDSGKSNILRALRWVFENRPLGFPAKVLSDFTEGEETEVQLKLNDQTLSLRKNKSGAVYKVGDQEFKGFGKEVPEEVLKVLNISELNFSPQISLPFLIWDSAGEVGRVINRVTKLERVDEWVSLLTSQLNSLSKEQKIFKDQADETKVHLKGLDFLPDLEKEVKRLEELNNQIESLQQEEKELSVLLDEMSNIHLDIQNLEEWLKCEKEVEKLENMIASMTNLSIEEDEINEVLALSCRVEDKKAVLEIEDLVGQTERLFEKVVEKGEEEQDLRRLVNDILSLDSQISVKGEEVEKLTDEFGGILEELGKCPLCFSPLGEKGITRVLEGI